MLCVESCGNNARSSRRWYSSIATSRPSWSETSIARSKLVATYARVFAVFASMVRECTWTIVSASAFLTSAAERGVSIGAPFGCGKCDSVFFGFDPNFDARSGSECKEHFDPCATAHAPHRLPFLFFSEHRSDIVQTSLFAVLHRITVGMGTQSILSSYALGGPWYTSWYTVSSTTSYFHRLAMPSVLSKLLKVLVNFDSSEEFMGKFRLRYLPHPGTRALSLTWQTR
jgi:hypothetical protein